MNSHFQLLPQSKLMAWPKPRDILCFVWKSVIFTVNDNYVPMTITSQATLSLPFNEILGQALLSGEHKPHVRQAGDADEYLR